jgi:acetoin utilization protein AcuB
MIVRSCMTPQPITVRADCSCNHALKLMEENRIHHLPVVDRDGALAGIVAERDLLLAALNYSGSGVEVGDVMRRDVVSVRDDAPITHAASLMARRAIGGLPVVKPAGQVIGVVTETDIFRAFVNVLEAKTSRARDALIEDALELEAPAAPAVEPSAAKASPAAPARTRKSAKPTARTGGRA